MFFPHVPYPKLVVVVRHGESEGNVRSHEERTAWEVSTNRYKLTDRGRAQCEITGAWLREHVPSPDRIVRSYYARTNETAALLYPNAEIREDELLAEKDGGIWAVRTIDQIRDQAPWELDRRERMGHYHYRPIGGENMPDVETRVRAFRRSMRLHHTGKGSVVIVGHGHWILLWRKRNEGFSIEETERRYQEDEVAENASVLLYHNTWHPDGYFYLQHDPEVDYIIPWEGKL
ncbi:hypothetical protein CO174_00410 [Candidatus Uhrbacteria bacterium CG_4_9_14_3_um_filter_50_9]|uniref:Uncharacterized protein n=1 Tax=Candidatus Uhrbacteria bacterium CG_4_9_14_3_um_filter_50_9 TaxID=1975035 RepID=A0A2M7XEF2_9BACT|nr:MAG: hypothetical protein CO174_00410 [Candidatus Uhrbacteria bacterium CG_4_9_14_3_um_filter_50_9]